MGDALGSAQPGRDLDAGLLAAEAHIEGQEPGSLGIVLQGEQA